MVWTKSGNRPQVKEKSLLKAAFFYALGLLTGQFPVLTFPLPSIGYNVFYEIISGILPS
jgi:hypothetical protein